MNIDKRENHSGDFRFLIAEIESLETSSISGDYIIRTKDGDTYYFRCSCCITFQGIYLNIG